jgi:hypothetical protein
VGGVLALEMLRGHGMGIRFRNKPESSAPTGAQRSQN